MRQPQPVLLKKRKVKANNFYITGRKPGNLAGLLGEPTK